MAVLIEARKRLEGDLKDKQKIDDNGETVVEPQIWTEIFCVGKFAYEFDGVREDWGSLKSQGTVQGVFPDNTFAISNNGLKRADRTKIALGGKGLSSNGFKNSENVGAYWKEYTEGVRGEIIGLFEDGDVLLEFMKIYDDGSGAPKFVRLPTQNLAHLK
jgi:hypothetical protein